MRPKLSKRGDEKGSFWCFVDVFTLTHHINRPFQRCKMLQHHTSVRVYNFLNPSSLRAARNSPILAVYHPRRDFVFLLFPFLPRCNSSQEPAITELSEALFPVRHYTRRTPAFIKLLNLILISHAVRYTSKTSPRGRACSKHAPCSAWLTAQRRRQTSASRAAPRRYRG